MTKKGTLTRLSLDEIRARAARGESKTRADAPEAEPLPEEFWANAVRVDRRPPKQSVHLRVDAEVLAWFKAQGAGHLTLMNEVLKAYAVAKARKAG